MEKPLINTITCERLLFYVCKLCAPDPRTEHPSAPPPEPASGPSGMWVECRHCHQPMGRNGFDRSCVHTGGLCEFQSVMRPAEPGCECKGPACTADHSKMTGHQYLDHVTPRKPCSCTSASMHSILCQSADPLPDPSRSVRLCQCGVSAWTTEGEFTWCQRCGRPSDDPNIPPNTEWSPESPRTYSAQAFLRAVAESSWAFGGTGEFLAVVSNFEPAAQLTEGAIRQLRELQNYQSQASAGRTSISLQWSDNDPCKLMAHVAWQGDDGFSIGGPVTGVLRFEAGTILVTIRKRAMGVLGWVKGRPLGVFLPEFEREAGVHNLAHRIGHLLARGRFG
jgi:hypothetical protein